MAYLAVHTSCSVCFAQPLTASKVVAIAYDTASFCRASGIVTAYKAPALSMASIAAWQVSDWSYMRFEICCKDACAVATAKRSFQDIPWTLLSMHQQDTEWLTIPKSFNALEILPKFRATAWSISLHIYRIRMHAHQTKRSFRVLKWLPGGCYSIGTCSTSRYLEHHST